MKTEKEIRNRLNIAVKELKIIKDDFNKAVENEEDIGYICDEWRKVEMEIAVLKWTLGN